MSWHSKSWQVAALLALGWACGAPAAARQVTQPVDESQRITLAGNTRPEATAANDRGLVADSLPLDHMQLLLNRPAENQAALDATLANLTNPNSPSFHHWLTAAQITASFGPDQADVKAVTDWLSAHGFTVNAVQNGGVIIDFSGSAGAVREAFGTEIHALNVAGTAHIANMADPKIPAALSTIIKGVVSLNDFRPQPRLKLRAAYTFTSNGSATQAVVPADLATIYNFTPLFAAGITGTGQTIAVLEDSDVYSTTDWTNFRKTLGLSTYTSGSLTQTHPTGTAGNCRDPGVVANNELEATLDGEWASAAAPNAAIMVAACADTSTTFGGLIALQNLLQSAKPPAIISISYGECEAENGAAANAAYNTVYQQAAAQGISIFVAAGDEGAASCDAGQSYATHGIGVSAFASTPYNVAVGGTDFGDLYANSVNTYWSSSNNSVYESAKSYIPEIPWNDSCASALISSTEGFSTPVGPSGFCSSFQAQSYLTVAGGSGGPSGCATGTPSISGVVSGTCKGFAKPSWQSVLGNPADKVRDIPDVSLFAADGVWGHYYVICDSDLRDGGAACTGAPKGWSGAGGTSFATPIMAGIQALINQKMGASQGNPNPVLYALASSEYGKSGSTSCNATLGKNAASTCVFHDITLGDNDQDCTGTTDCYDSSSGFGFHRGGFGQNATPGALSTSSSTDSIAYGTTKGWDFATGLGSVNVTNLVNAWGSSTLAKK